MDKKIEKLECELCGKKVWVLYPIIIAIDYPFFNRRGVCKECWNRENIDDQIAKKNLKLMEEQIKKSKENSEFWKKELKELKKARKEVNSNR